MDAQTFELTVNGDSRSVTTEPGTSLLLALRNHLGMKAAKFGCGLGLCGACTVLFDDFPTYSCQIPVRDAVGHDVRTLEGLSDDADTIALQNAFLDQQAGQCGYCLSGMVVRATAYLRSSGKDSRDEIASYLDRNLCRCGSQQRIVTAVVQAAKERHHG